MTLTKSEVLNKANDIVNGDRQNDYGEVENNFQVIADLWTAYLKSKTDMTDAITAQDVAVLMIFLKCARISSGHNKDDNWIDIAGYAACGGSLKGLDTSVNIIEENICDFGGETKVSIPSPYISLDAPSNWWNFFTNMEHGKNYLKSDLGIVAENPNRLVVYNKSPWFNRVTKNKELSGQVCYNCKFWIPNGGEEKCCFSGRPDISCMRFKPMED